jgi:hypothetical protein
MNENLQLFVNALGAVLIPIVLFILGQWFVRSKERSDRTRQDADQLAAFLEHLSSENMERRKLALLALTYLRNAGHFPDVLLQAVESISKGDDLEVAAAARFALGEAAGFVGLDSEKRSLVLELLLPMKVHFERTRDAFRRWTDNPPPTPNLVIEDAIMESNSTIRDLLKAKWYMIPAELQDDALLLIQHYDAWMDEYERLRPDGIRNPDVPYVFVGPQGTPFPREAERNFMLRYEELTGEGKQSMSS